jgi:4-oxalocrotonate tautomerase
MPLIVFEVGGELTKDQKTELVQRLTKDSAEVTGIPEEAFVVYIHENDHDNVGVGGKLLTRIIAERG